MEAKRAPTDVDTCAAARVRSARCRGRAWSFPAKLAFAFAIPVIIGGTSRAAERGAGPADSLLRLVAPDVALVLTIEGLRDQVRTFNNSRLAANLRQLPAVRAWFESEKFQQFEQSRARIEAVLGASLVDLRDELLGDAVLLALRLPPEGAANSSQARGLLLLRARDHALLERLIRVINTTQQQSGELDQIGQRTRGGTTYHVREFPAAAGRTPEWYVTYPDGTFAFSNSEQLIQAVVDRKRATRSAQDHSGGGTGLTSRDDAGAMLGQGVGDLPAFHAVARRLPHPALARLFVNPRQVGRLLAAAPRPSKPADARLMAMVERYLAAVDFAGAALTWNDRTIEVRTVEMLDPPKLDPWLRRWAGGTRRREPGLERVPSTALALACGHVDAAALFDALSGLVPDEDRPRVANIETILSGLLLGQDVRRGILPRLGPGVVAYLDSPSDSAGGKAAGGETNPGSTWPFPLVMVVNFARDVEVSSPKHRAQRKPLVADSPVPVAAALENALRTVLALSAMDEKRHQGRSRIQTRVVAGVTVATLDPPVPFAYAIDRTGSRLVVGTSADAVVRYLENSSKADAGQRFCRLRAAAFPDDETFFCADLEALDKLAGSHRDRLVQTLAARKQRPAADVERDLVQVLALARLFEAAFVTSRFDPDASAVLRRAGLILREKAAK
jgi:hypothetical protein